MQRENQSNEFSSPSKQGLEEQNDLLFESNFQEERSAEKLRANGMVFDRLPSNNSYSHNPLQDKILADNDKSDLAQPKIKIKTSMTSSVTARSSGGVAGIADQQFGELAASDSAD